MSTRFHVQVTAEKFPAKLDRLWWDQVECLIATMRGSR